MDRVSLNNHEAHNKKTQENNCENYYFIHSFFLYSVLISKCHDYNNEELPNPNLPPHTQENDSENNSYITGPRPPGLLVIAAAAVLAPVAVAARRDWYLADKKMDGLLQVPKR